jgi:hypothetical protein
MRPLVEDGLSDAHHLTITLPSDDHTSRHARAIMLVILGLDLGRIESLQAEVAPGPVEFPVVSRPALPHSLRSW